MTLSEAIEVIRFCDDGITEFCAGEFTDVFDMHDATAIATILNAVVKGELK